MTQPTTEHRANHPFESFSELSDITMRLYKKVTNEQFQALSECMQYNAHHLQEYSKIRRIEDLFSANMHWMSKMMPALFEHTQNIMETLIKSQQEYNEWFKSGYTQMDKQAKVMREKMTFVKK